MTKIMDVNQIRSTLVLEEVSSTSERINHDEQVRRRLQGAEPQLSQHCEGASPGCVPAGLSTEQVDDEPAGIANAQKSATQSFNDQWAVLAAIAREFGGQWTDTQTGAPFGPDYSATITKGDAVTPARSRR